MIRAESVSVTNREMLPKTINLYSHIIHRQYDVLNLSGLVNLLTLILIIFYFYLNDLAIYFIIKKCVY